MGAHGSPEAGGRSGIGSSDFAPGARAARVYPRGGVKIPRILWGAVNWWWYKGSRDGTEHEPELNVFARHGGVGHQPRRLFRTKR